MIDIGSSYKLTLGTIENKMYFYGSALAVEGPLVKLRDKDSEREVIFNLTSASVISIERW